MLSQAAMKVRAWMSNYIPEFNMDVITYPCPNPGRGLTKKQSLLVKVAFDHIIYN